MPCGPGGEAFCSRLLRGRAWSRMMHRFAQLADHAALRSQKAPPPGPLGALPLRVSRSTAFLHFGNARRCSYPCDARWPDCGQLPAKANRVSWVGKPSGSVKRRGRRARMPDASCGTTTDRGEAASRRVHDPRHLAPNPTAFVRSLLVSALRLLPKALPPGHSLSAPKLGRRLFELKTEPTNSESLHGELLAVL